MSDIPELRKISLFANFLPKDISLDDKDKYVEYKYTFKCPRYMTGIYQYFYPRS